MISYLSTFLGNRRNERCGHLARELAQRIAAQNFPCLRRTMLSMNSATARWRVAARCYRDNARASPLSFLRSLIGLSVVQNRTGSLPVATGVAQVAASMKWTIRLMVSPSRTGPTIGRPWKKDRLEWQSWLFERLSLDRSRHMTCMSGGASDRESCPSCPIGTGCGSRRSVAESGRLSFPPSATVPPIQNVKDRPVCNVNVLSSSFNRIWSTWHLSQAKLAVSF